jgi:hypothetical protein
MTADHRVATGATGLETGQYWRLLWFGFLIILYVLYAWSIYATGGLRKPLDLSHWRLLQKTLLIAAPLCVVYLWMKRDKRFCQ